MDFDSAVALLRRLIATPSPSREEGAAADIMEAELRSMGYKPHRKGNNVWAEASARDDSKPRYCSMHISTRCVHRRHGAGIRMMRVSRMGVFTVWEATIRAEVSCRCWQHSIFWRSGRSRIT